MPISPATNNINLQPSLSTQKMQQLPKDLENVVGKVYLKGIDIISKIQAFFLELFYGKLSCWKNFVNNINRRVDEISIDKKFKFYDKYKKPELSYGDTLNVGFRAENDKEANVLKESNKNLKAYKEQKIKFTNEEFEIIMPFLEEISSKETLNATNILIDLNKFFTCKNVSQEVKNLINQKLNPLPEYQILKKDLEEKLEQRRKEEELEQIRLEERLEQIRQNKIKEENQIKRNKALKRVAIITAISIATLGIGLAFYQYIKVPTSIIPLDLNSTINKTISLATNTTNLTTYPKIPIDPNSTINKTISSAINTTNLTTSIDTMPWDDFKILGRTANEDVKNVFLKIGEFLIKKPFEITNNSIFSRR